MRLPPGEPEAGPWRPVRVQELLELVLAAAGRPSGRPRVVAVDGRGAAGKSTLAARLHALAPRSAVVHTDDIAWHEPFFGWGHLLADEVLRPLHAGRDVAWRPPQWERRGRTGLVEVRADVDLVVVEGTGASQQAYEHLVDATVWVQSDLEDAEERGLARDIASGVNGDAAETTAFWHEWMAEELAFLAREQPWSRSCVVVNGTPRGDPGDDVVEVADPPAVRVR